MKKKVKQTKAQKIELLKQRIGSLQNEIKTLNQKRDLIDVRVAEMQSRLDKATSEFAELAPKTELKSKAEVPKYKVVDSDFDIIKKGLSKEEADELAVLLSEQIARNFYVVEMRS